MSERTSPEWDRPAWHPARLTSEGIEAIRSLERRLGVVLVAYERDSAAREEDAREFPGEGGGGPIVHGLAGDPDGGADPLLPVDPFVEPAAPFSEQESRLH